jgi:lipopolysaccharide export system permease protein
VTILGRYLLRLHLVPFVFALSALTGILLLNQIAKRIGDLVGKGLPWTVIVEVFALSVPFLVAMTLPMAALVAVLYPVSRLTADNEITAFKAGGISVGRMVFPLLTAGALLTVISFLFNDHVLPRSNHRLRALLTDINRTKPTFSLKEQAINEIRRSRLFLRAGRIDQATYTLYDVSIFDLGNQERQRVIYADSGFMAFTEDQENLYLTLFDGSTHESGRSDPRTFQLMDFRQDQIRIEGVGNTFARTLDDRFKGDREMSVCEMDSVIRTARRESFTSERQAHGIELNSLRDLVGLVPVQTDTVTPNLQPTAYCRALERISGWLSPQDLSAQEEEPREPVPTPPSQSSTQSLQERVEEVNRIAREAMTRPQRRATRVSSALVVRDRAKNARIREANYLVEAHKKYTIAFSCLVFVLVGVPMALRFPRGGVGLVIGLSLGVFTIYYVGLIAGESLANRLIVTPFWAMWSPNLVFTLVGSAMLWRIRTEATTVRSGDWSENLRQRFRKLVR